MSQASYSNEDRAVIVALRESGKSWQETATEASKKIGRTITVESARFQYKQAKRGAPSANGRSRPRRPRKTAKRGHTLDDFRAKFDITKKIEDKVNELLQDGEEYWTDDEFRGICGVSVQNWRRHAELDRFKPYQFKKPGFHAWAPKDVVEQMKEITGHAGH